MGAHRPFATVNPDLHVPSALAFGSSMERCGVVGVSEGDVGRVGSEAQAAEQTRAHTSARRVIPGITGSIEEERYGATAV
jgi:hypothetical protein